MGAGAVIAGGTALAGAASGALQADAAEDAAKQQRRASESSIAEQRRAREQAREDLAPFRQAGQDAISDLQGVDLGFQTDRQQQLEFLQNDPVFQAIADQTQQRLSQGQAAAGQFASGGTANQLQNELLAQGEGLIGNQANRIGNRFNQLFNLVSAGQSAAAGQGQTSIQQAGRIGNNLLQRGQAQASGEIGQANALANAIGGLSQAAGLANQAGLFGGGGGTSGTGASSAGSPQFNLGAARGFGSRSGFSGGL